MGRGVPDPDSSIIGRAVFPGAQLTRGAPFASSDLTGIAIAAVVLVAGRSGVDTVSKRSL